MLPEPAPDPPPACGAGEAPVRHGPRHRSRRRRRTPWSGLAPLVAVLVVALVSARSLRSSPLADDGALTGPAWSWLHGGPAPALLTPEGLATVQTAGWAWLTRAFERQDGLVPAGRELLWTTLLVSCLLLWGLARRSGLGSGPAAVAVLAFGAVPGLVLLHAVSSPASLAVPWLLLAALLASDRRRPRWVRVLGAACLVPAVLLAPDVAMLAVAALAGALAAGRGGRSWSPTRRVVAAGLLAPVFVGLVLVLPAWDPQPAIATPWAAGQTRSVVLTAALLTIGVLAAWVLPRWRPPAAALAVTTLAAVAPPGRFSALVVCLPVAALLVGALLQRAIADPLVARARPVLAVVGGAALAVAVLLAAVVLPAGAVDDFGAADRQDLVAWLAAEVPAGTPVAAEGLLADDLGRAGVPIGDGGLRVTRGEPADPADVIARFGDDGTALVVVDPDRTEPDADEQQYRRTLAAALLTNPTTADAGQATGALLSGDVDPRLLTLLAGIAAQYGVGISELPAVPGEVGTPIRRAVVDSVAGTPLREDPGLVALVTTWLSAQLPPYAPASVTPQEDGLLISYDYVSDPDALVGATGG